MQQQAACLRGSRPSYCTGRKCWFPPPLSRAPPWLNCASRYRVKVRSLPGYTPASSSNNRNPETTDRLDRPAADSTQRQPAPPQWERFIGFMAAGDPKEAWLSISASTLTITLPAALLGLLLYNSPWGGAPPQLVNVAEAAAWVGAVAAALTEVWKILEGFQG